MAELTHKIEPEEPEPIPETMPAYVPRVYLEVSPKQLKAVQVGKNVQIKLTGKVVGLEANEHEEGRSHHSISLELREVTIIDDDNEFSKMAEED